MVSRRLLIAIVGISAAFAACTALDRTEATSNVVSSGHIPIILDVEPEAATVGETITVTGRGFSFVAPENVVSLGETVQVADTYAFSEEGDEILTLVVPENALEGETSLIVITEGRASNAFPFEVLPSP